MGFLKKVFGNGESQNDMPKMEWNQLTDLKQLDEIVKESNDRAVLIFKHSTRCGISRMVLKQFENEFDLKESEIKPYYLDLLEYRSISNEIASRFGVIHQSPQIILLKNERVIHDASHSEIQVSNLRNK